MLGHADTDFNFSPFITSEVFGWASKSTDSKSFVDNIDVTGCANFYFYHQPQTFKYAFASCFRYFLLHISFGKFYIAKICIFCSGLIACWSRKETQQYANDSSIGSFSTLPSLEFIIDWWIYSRLGRLTVAMLNVSTFLTMHSIIV